MTHRSLYQNVYALVRGMELTRSEELILPTLCLLYTGIDIVASLERSTGEGTRASFERWCRRYLLKGQNLPCAAADLYAARCGVLHTASAEADLIRKGEAKPIVYAWGSVSAADLGRAAQRLGGQEITLHVDELVKIFRNAVADYFADLEADPQRETVLSTAASVWFTSGQPETLRKYLDATDEP